MKFVVLGLTLICTLASAIKMDGHHGGYKNMLEDFLEKFKTIMRTGNDTLGLPVLDPFTLDQLPIAIDEETIKLDALLTNVRVDALSGYDVNKGDLEIIGLKLVLNISWPLIAASTNYSMKGKVENFEIYGNGEMKISPQGFSLDTEISFTMNGKYLKIKDMKLNIFLRALDFHATGLFDDNDLSEFLSNLISDVVPELIEDYHDTIVNRVIPIVMGIGNEFLATKTLMELLELLGL
ncbi:Circadian clock-controlled protein [Camponotus japonicus]